MINSGLILKKLILSTDPTGLSYIYYLSVCFEILVFGYFDHNSVLCWSGRRQEDLGRANETGVSFEGR